MILIIKVQSPKKCYTLQTMMMKKINYEVLTSSSDKIIKSWTKGVSFEAEAKKQLQNIAELPFIYKWIAAMPDVHLGKEATIGSVIPTTKAVIPSAVGVDIGCGMMAVKTMPIFNEFFT